MARSEKKEAVISAFNRIACPEQFFAGDWMTRRAKANEHKIVSQMLREDSKGKALDIGCGVGGYFDILLQKGYKVIGFDIAENMINVCRSKFTKERLELMVADVEALPFQQTSVDLVLCIDTLQYITEVSRASVLRSMAELVKPKGVIIVEVKNKACPIFKFRNSKGSLRETYSIASVTSVLRHNGCNIEAIKGVFPPTFASPIVVVKARKMGIMANSELKDELKTTARPLSDNGNLTRKVAVFVANYIPDIGGAPKNKHELAKRLRRKGHSVEVVTCNTVAAPSFEEIDGVMVYRLPCWSFVGGEYPVPKPSLKGLAMVLKIFSRRKYDIVNTQTRFFITSLIGWQLSFLRRIPLIHFENGAGHYISENKVIDFIARIYDHTIGSLIVKSAKVNLALSKSGVEFLSHLGASNGRVLPNGIDVESFARKPIINSNTLNSTTITFVGRLVYLKGVQDLIHAFAELRREFAGLRLLIGGDGPYRYKLEQKVRELCLENVSFLGKLEPQDVVGILNITDVFVNPSYSEGVPTTVLEAMAAGIPAVATNVGGTYELTKDAGSVLFVAPGDLEALKDAIQVLLRDKENRKEMGRRGQEYIRNNLSWDRIIDKWEDVIQDIC